MAQSYYRDLFISREQEFKNIANKYDKAVFNEYFPSLMAILARLLLESPKDYLGTIFARLNLGQHYRGQFFTPSHICEFMAEITFNENLEKAIQEKVALPSQPADLELWFWDWLNVCKIADMKSWAANYILRPLILMSYVSA